MKSSKRRFLALIRRFAIDERGTTSIEYGLIAVLVVVGMLVGLRALGVGNSSSWGDTSSKITNAMQRPST
jgi:Flp pilus assembly pilin Flp